MKFWKWNVIEIFSFQRCHLTQTRESECALCWNRRGKPVQRQITPGSTTELAMQLHVDPEFKSTDLHTPWKICFHWENKHNKSNHTIKSTTFKHMVRQGIVGHEPVSHMLQVELLKEASLQCCHAYGSSGLMLTKTVFHRVLKLSTTPLCGVFSQSFRKG